MYKALVTFGFYNEEDKYEVINFKQIEASNPLKFARLCAIEIKKIEDKLRKRNTPPIVVMRNTKEVLPTGDPDDFAEQVDEYVTFYFADPVKDSWLTSKLNKPVTDEFYEKHKNK